MSAAVLWTIHESPLGPLTLRSGPRGLTALHFADRGVPLDAENGAPAAFAESVRQLEEYFAGRRQRFDLALDLGGTPFRRAVWERLLAIPHGATISYTALARALGRPGCPSGRGGSRPHARARHRALPREVQGHQAACCTIRRAPGKSARGRMRGDRGACSASRRCRR